MVALDKTYHANNADSMADDKQYYSACDSESETGQSKSSHDCPALSSDSIRTAESCDSEDSKNPVDSNGNCKSMEVVPVNMGQPTQTPPVHSSSNFIVRFFKKKSQSLSKDQFLTIVILSFVEFFASTVVSIQAPFYPDVARQKGATASEYGFVFGVFELTVFIMSPIYGAKMSYLGPTRVFNWGILVTAICCVIFGFLDAIEGRAAFIWTGLIVRIFEAMGDAAFETASFTIIALEFPNAVASNFAILEIFFGLGLIIGPTLGGALYEIGGFRLPFFTMGGLLFASAIVTYYYLPDSSSSPRHRPTKAIEKKPDSFGSSPEVTDDEPIVHGGFHMFKMLQIPVIAMTAYSIVASTAGVGFISANLDHHLEQFHLNKMAVGAVFILDGGVYAVTAPAWGWICDHTNRQKLITMAGAVFTILGFLFIGPIPYFPYDTTLPMSCFGLALFGVGLAATLVSAFLQLLKDAIEHGYPDDISTYGLVSGLWTSMAALGYFIGPSVGGVLEDWVGFRWASVFIIGGQAVLMILLFGFYTSKAIKNRGSAEISTGGESGDSEIRMDKENHNICKMQPPTLPPTGNGRDLPHMQSSLSPQGFGLYNSVTGDDGGGDAPLAIKNSKESPRNKQTFQYNDYMIASPHNQQEYRTPNLPCDDGRGRRDTMGFENLPTHINFGGGNNGGGGYLNATNGPSMDSSKATRNFSPASSSLEMNPLKNLPYTKLGGPGDGNAIMRAGTPTTMRSGRVIPGSVDMDRNLKKDRLIDSLSQSDMITCLPGFKKRPNQFPGPRKSWPPNDQVVHRISQQGVSQNMMDFQGAPSPIAERRAGVPSSYAGQAPASLSPLPNYNRDPFIDREVRNVGGDEIGRYMNPSRTSNTPSNPIRPIPPCSPITRAKAAIGHAQKEILKTNSYVEEERDRQKPIGSWKNMGTPFFSGSEPVLKSAERQQKVKYRMDLERQIMASKMRKEEQQRREKEGTDHPLGPEYAHPALTYYNPPQKIINSGPTAPDSPTTAALTRYMKEKYSLCNPSPSTSARSAASPSMRYPQEMGSNGGTQAGRRTTATINRFPPQQNPAYQQAMVPGNMARPFNQQPQGPVPAMPPNYGYPAGVQHPARQLGYPMNMNPWQMYQHPAYAQYYGQMSAGNPGAVHPQQVAAVAQYNPQQNYSPTPALTLPPQMSPSSPLPRRLEPLDDPPFDRAMSSGSGDDDRDGVNRDDFDFEAIKEKAYRSQKIWQTSDELPDPGLRTAVYKAELRKQIDEDRRRKADRVRRERLEEERLEMKIKEFQDEERRRMRVEERTRAELEEYQAKNKTQQQQNRRRKNEAFTISQNSARQQRQGGQNVRRRRQRPRSEMMNEHHHPHPRMGAGDCEEMRGNPDEFNNHYNHLMMQEQNARQYRNDNEKSEFSPYPMADDASEGQAQLPRKASPPVPVVQRKLLQDKSDNFDNRPVVSGRIPEKQIHSNPSQTFFHQLKERLKSEKDLVERRLQEKVESTHKNLNLLKYTLNHD